MDVDGHDHCAGSIHFSIFLLLIGLRGAKFAPLEKHYTPNDQFWSFDLHCKSNDQNQESYHSVGMHRHQL